MNFLPSVPIEKTLIKAKASPPNVIINDGYDIVESINGINKNGDWDKFEYSVDNGPWISGRYLKTEDLTGNKILRVRFKATEDSLPSQNAMVSFRENLPLTHVILST